MSRKLLKRIAVCVMTAALCVGAFVPLTAEAAGVSAASIVGDWYCADFDGMKWNGNTSDGKLHFKDNGTYSDMWGHSKAYHMEAGSLNVGGKTVSYDFWGALSSFSKISSVGEQGYNAQIFIMHGDDDMEYMNLVYDSDNSQWKLNDSASWTRVEEKKASSSSKESRKPKESRKRRKSPEEKAAEEAERLKAEEERKALEQASREAVRLEGEAAELGFENAAQMQAAQSAGKDAGEYYNNAVVTTEGIENAIPVAQGGNLIIDGQTTNASATISKVSSIYVDSVRAAREGTVLNVVDVQFPALGAVVNFYMPGVMAEDNITAAQYIDGAWTDVEVVEVRADHVVLNLKSNGVVAFLK